MGRSREGYRQPEERTLADLLVGHRIFLQYAVGPEPDPDDPGRELRGAMEAKTGAYWLHAVSYQGLEVSRELAGEDAEIFLVPWGGVLVLDGVPRGQLEEEALRKFAIDRQSCSTGWATRKRGTPTWGSTPGGSWASTPTTRRCGRR